MKNFTRTLSLLAISVAISSCQYLQKKEVAMDYLQGQSKMDVKSFFNGDIEAFAIKQDKNGSIIDTFTVKINGKWDGNKGVIQHNFYYKDGKKDSRTWLVTINSDGTINAVGHDVLAPAKGKQIGNAAQLIYSLMLNNNGSKEETNFEDRMYLVDAKSMIMISEFKRKNIPATDITSSGKIITSLKKELDQKKTEIKFEVKEPLKEELSDEL